MASLLSTQERLSQLLPSVKCSTCHQPVPLADLGEHICVAPPPSPGHPGAAGPPRQDSASPARFMLPYPTQSAFRSSPLARIHGASRQDMSRPPVRPHGPGVLSTQSPNPTLSVNEGPSLRSRSPFPPNGLPSNPSPPRMPSRGSPSPGPLPPPGNDVPFPRRPSGPNIRHNTPPPPPRGPSPARLGPPGPSGPPMGYQRRPAPSGPLPSLPGPSPISNHLIVPPPSPQRMASFPPVVRQAPPPPPSQQQSLPSPRPPPPGSHPHAFIPVEERGIDTSSGGEAGMAGVGRRGFAAAARAAMFYPMARSMAPQPPPPPPPQQHPQPQYSNNLRRPQNLELDMAARPNGTTPPLSAGTGSGYSSHSPGPHSPLPEFAIQQHYHHHQQQQQQQHPQQLQPAARIRLTPSPPLSQGLGHQHQAQITTPTPMVTPTKPLRKGAPTLTIPPPAIDATTPGTTPPSTAVPPSPRLPFFEKLKNRAALSSPDDVKTPRLPMGSSNNSDAASSTSSNPTFSGDSEAGGCRLAYADSSSTTDSGGGGSDGVSERGERRGRPLVSPRGGGSGAGSSDTNLARSILRSLPNNHSQVQFGSVSERSRSRSNDSSSTRLRFGSSSASSTKPTTTTTTTQETSQLQSSSNSDMPPSGSTTTKTTHLRNPSFVSSSSYSSSSTSSNDRDPDDHDARHNTTTTTTSHRHHRSNSSAMIAPALGLSQTPPSEYGRLGGPGRPVGVGSSVSSSSSGGGGRMQVPGDDVVPTVDERKGSVDQGRRGAEEAKPKDVVLNLPGPGSGSEMQRSNTVQVMLPSSPEVGGGKSLKLPARSQSERESGGLGKERERERERQGRKPRVCLRCAKSVEDERWVSSDAPGGGVLCERCWKNMYLPKCRRCSLPIERQAVSSSDGQLKGKYHKDCFNCHTCHRPFPDKTFYVYDGKPLCAYHYHEANDSLCAAARCGQPIEGPCAVSHAGDRYHPEHMTCEYDDDDDFGEYEYGGCGERLSGEYWEVEGRMLCEKHAGVVLCGRSGGADGDGEEEEERVRKRKKGLKRVTRFIDLAGGANENLSGSLR